MVAKIPPSATLARVQELHDAGNSFRKIAEILAAEGVPPSGPRSTWHHQNVRWCLERIEEQSGAAATWGLSPQIRARLTAQGEEIEGLAVAGLQQLGHGVQDSVQAELQAIQDAAAEQAAVVRGALGRWGIWLGLGGLGLSLGLGLGAWGVGDWMARDILSWAKAVQEARATVGKIEQQTWGVEFRETPGGRFVLLPKEHSTGWKVQERPAVKIGK